MKTSTWPYYLLSILCVSITQGFDRYHPPDDPTLFTIDSLTEPGYAFPFGGKAPVARVHHTLVHNPTYLFLYGGYSTNGTKLGDMNLFHIPSQSWSSPIQMLECCNNQDEIIDTIGADIPINTPFIRQGFQGDYPLPRVEHSACVVNEEMYLFGGLTDEYGFVNDFYKFNAISLKWTTLDRVTGQSVPRRRAGHVLIPDVLRMQLYLFGGRSNLPGDPSRIVMMADVWMYDILSNTWTRLDDPNVNNWNVKPSGREHVAATHSAIIQNSFYIFGGSDPTNGIIFDELWRFDLADSVWTLLSPSKDVSNSIVYQFAPPPLAHAHLLPSLCPSAIDSSSEAVQTAMNDCGGLLVYGGLGSGGYCGNENACNTTQSAIGQVYLYSFSSQTWHSPFFDLSSDVIDPMTEESHWLYARLSTNLLLEEDQKTTQIRRDDRGKYYKTYAMEKITFMPERKMLFEFGGVQVKGAGNIRNEQETNLFTTIDEAAIERSAAFIGKNRSDVSIYDVHNEITLRSLDAGGNLFSVYSDTQAGEVLRGQMIIPTTNYWEFQDSFTKTNDRNMTIEYLRTLRMFTVADRDIILAQENNY